MMKTIFAKKIYTQSRILDNRTIFVNNGMITDVQYDPLPSAADYSVECLSAAFTDLQVNGGATFNFTEKGDMAAVKDIHDACVALGTGYMLPTLISSPLENILKGIEAVKNFQQQFPLSGVLGVHLEGPFINPLEKGCHALSWIRKPTDKELKEIIHYGKDIIKLITIAPEIISKPQLDMLLDSGITIAAGHSNATYEEAIYAFNRGVRLVTHLFNAMSPFVPRQPGLVGAAFDVPNVAAPMILDGIHSTFSSARMAYKIKNRKLFFVSDALFVGKKKKSYHWGDFNASLQDGRYINKDGHLAGSTISLGDAVRNAVLEVGIPLAEAIDMVTYRPANAIGLDRLLGSVLPGYPAVFTVFDNSLKSFSVLRL